MSFKKTSEGRVFFQGSKETSNDHPDRRIMTGTKRIQSPQANNVQIVSLLKSLNDKLQASQAERRQLRKELQNYRDMIEELQDHAHKDKNAAMRATRAEQVATDAIRELEETRKLILQIETKADRADRNTLSLKTQLIQTAQNQKTIAEKQEDFEQKLEDTAAATSKMTRQVDKAIEDRTRFMRKIERIEEAVLQTQDALSAKAMVLLTDQGIAEQTIDIDQEGVLLGKGKHKPEQIPETKSSDPSKDKSFFTRVRHLFQMNGNMAALALLVAIIVGWGINELQQRPQEASSGLFSSVSQAIIPLEPAAGEERAQIESENRNWTINNDVSAFSTAIETNTDREDTNDIGAIDINDDKELLNLLEKDPDAVASALNAIEPRTTTDKPKTAGDVSAPSKTEKPAKLASVQKATETPPIIPAQSKIFQKDLKSLIKPDPSLPDIGKQLQEQAFEGIPEAQHDLAAIYIAGHGGVEQNFERAAFWFDQAASGNIANAAYNLGVLNQQGLGVERDLKKAIRWYRQAAVFGHPEAQYNLGIAYIEGIGVAYDAEKAAQYFESAARKKITEAAYNLGLIYENGLLGDAKPDEALMWYKIAADQNNSEASKALKQLARTLDIGLDEVNKIADDMIDRRATENSEVGSREE